MQQTVKLSGVTGLRQTKASLASTGCLSTWTGTAPRGGTWIQKHQFDAFDRIQLSSKNGAYTARSVPPPGDGPQFGATHSKIRTQKVSTRSYSSFLRKRRKLRSRNTFCEQARWRGSLKRNQFGGGGERSGWSGGVVIPPRITTARDQGILSSSVMRGWGNGQGQIQTARPTQGGG